MAEDAFQSHLVRLPVGGGLVLAPAPAAEHGALHLARDRVAEALAGLKRTEGKQTFEFHIEE